MKILLVRGKNLASLAGDWVVDFAAPPLAKAGTFAITGPTGAGKSTLLDAICLALYGQTPRYQSAVKHRVGHHHEDDDEQVSSGDARGILRRGSGEGYAEVEFLAHDGRRYRARWSVQRAHKKAGGRLQNANRSVVDVATGQVLESGIDKVNGWVIEHLGLTLDQFTRSVLLPQGEFAAFLRADARERAGLLEKLTATVRYGLVGKLAFERAREAQTQVDEEQKKLGEHRLLSADEREVVEGARVEAEATATLAGTLAERLEAQARWHARLEELGTLLARAQAVLAAAGSDHEAAATRRQALSDVLAVEPFRSLIERASEAARRLVETVDHDRLAQGRAAEANSAATRAREAAEAARVALLADSAARENAAPELAEARRLDALLVAHEASTRAATAAALGRARELEAAQVARRKVNAELDANAARRAGAEAWLDRNPGIAPLAAEWSLARANLAGFARHEAERARHQGRATPLLEAHALAAGTHAELDARSAARAGEAVLQAQRLAAAETDAAQHPLEAAKTARRECEARRLSLTQARNLLANAARAELVARNAAEASATHTVESGRQAQRAAQAEARADAHAVALAEVERLLSRARLTVDVAVHREALRPGEDCPLCGASKHPYRDRPPVVDELLANLTARQRELKQREKHERGEATAAAALAHASQRAAAGEALREQEARAEWSRHEGAWRALGRGAELSLLVDAEARLGADEAALEAWENEVDHAEQAAARAAAGVKAALEDWKRATSAAADARLATDDAAKAVGGAQEAIDDNARALRDAEAGVDASLHQLGGPLAAMGAWRGLLYADPTGFARKCAELVEAYCQVQSVIADCAREEAALSARVVALEGALAEALSRQDEAEAARKAAADALDASRALRERVLGGRAVDMVEKEIAEHVKSRQAAFDAARSTAEAATVEAGAARATATAAKDALDKATLDATSRSQARDAALAEAGLGLPLAEARLAVPRDWIAGEKGALAALDRSLHDAAAARDARERDLAAHEATPRPEATPDEVATALAEARTARDSARTRVGVLVQQLAEDDARRARVAAINAQVEALKVIYERRRALNDLLGDATGSRFRTYVQSITLDVLVARANEQLARIAPRYRLGRAPGESLALQVIDLDSASAIRPVSSLSGGETFLASLALALGLSSLAARDLRIGSLFIDEGFGTLDAKTLETVIELLESLQASGRQVGIITHVPGLADSLGAWVRVVKHTATQSRIEVGTGPLPS